MSVDSGIYNQDPERYSALINELYENYPEITLPSEYAYFIQEDLLRFLIRLARYKFVARIIGKRDHVLEVGSGSGLGCIFLAQHCKKATGVDVKSTEVEEASSINKRNNVEFLKEDVFDMEPTHRYDVVLALDVIEHMPEEQGRQLVAAMKEQLRPTGLLVIGTPSIYSYEYQGALSKASHVKCYDQPELTGLMEDYFHRTIPFSMNDELVHTGHHKMAWYYFVLAFGPK